jgi:hypothetical protein
MPSIRQTKVTIGGPESTPGTAVARTHVIPVRALSDIDKKIEKAEDPAIIGRNMSSGEYIISDNVAGTISLTPRALGGFGKLVRSNLGNIVAPVEVGACIRVRYTGSDASAKFTAVGAGTNTLVAVTGVLGSETTNTNWNTDGSAVDFDDDAETVGAAVTLIDGFTDFDCEKVFGADSFDIDEAVAGDPIIAFTAKQGADTWVYIYFSGTVATTGVYKHDFIYQTATTEHSTYSVQKDGYDPNTPGGMLYDGIVVDVLRMNAALKGMLEGDADVLGFGETTGQTAEAESLENIDPLIFYNGSFTIDDADYTYIRDMSVEFNNNHNTEGYGQGSTSRVYHEKGVFQGSGECSIRLDTTSYLERAKAQNNTTVAISFYFKGKVIASSIEEFMIVELPYCSFSDFVFEENAGQIDVSIPFMVLYPKGSNVYNNPVTVTLISSESTQW